MKKILKLLVVIALSLIVFVSCKDDKKESANQNDTAYVIGQTFLVGAIEPTVGGTPWSLTTHGLSETVFAQDRDGKLFSRYVKEVKRLDAKNWELVLNEGIKFSDGTEVDAEALSWAMNTVMEENPLSNASAGKVNFTAKEKYVVDVTVERETQNIKALLTEWTNIIFKKTDNGYVFSGPYMIKEFDPGVQMTITPNPYYENADKRGEVIIKAFKDVASLKLAFESGELDMAFGITPEIAQELKDEGKNVESIDAGYQYFGINNLKSEFMSDKNIREAINLYLDREDYIKGLKGGKVANGLFAHYYEFAGDVKVENNKEKAMKILDDAGWILKDGVRQKDGKKLSIRILTYNSRPDLGIIMQIMTSQLKELGIETTTNIVDNIDVEMKNGKFDIVLYAQHSAPTGDPAYFLNQFLRTNEAKNTMGYSSKEVDELLNKMGVLEYGKESIAIAKKIQEIVYDDLPIFYLVDPEWNVALSDRLKNYRPYCGDYYIINSELKK